MTLRSWKKRSSLSMATDGHPRCTRALSDRLPRPLSIFIRQFQGDRGVSPCSRLPRKRGEGKVGYGPEAQSLSDVTRLLRSCGCRAIDEGGPGSLGGGC